MTLLLEVENLVKTYRLPREKFWQKAGLVQAVAGIGLHMRAGQNFGIVGESGSGKSTLARLVMALEAPDAGQVRLNGQDLHSLPPKALRALRPQFQMVFQDPFGSLDPRQTVGKIISEPLPRNDPAAVASILQAVALHPSDAQKYPHQFSGGQRQRIAIARALVTRPRLIVADEPVSALDVLVQAQVLNLMQDLQRDFDMAYLLISHDLSVVAHICADVAVMFAGRFVEQGAAKALFGHPAHPYTQALVDAVPRLVASPRRRMQALPPPGSSAGGCAYAPRCAFRQDICLAATPPLRAFGDGRLVACHLAENLIRT